MLSCEETWDVYLAFDGGTRHVRTFTLRCGDQCQSMQPAGTLWFRLPRDSSAVEYQTDGISFSPSSVTEEGMNRGIDVIFQKPIAWVRASFTTKKTPTPTSLEIDFRYRRPEGHKNQISNQCHKIVFHLPIGLPQDWTRFSRRLEFLVLAFRKGKSGNAESRQTRTLPLALQCAREYYFPPWGYHIEYHSKTRKGDKHGLFLVPRCLIYEGEKARWAGQGQSLLHFTIRPNMEGPFLGIIAGIVLVKLLSAPIWLVAFLIALFFPVLSRGFIWKILHLFS